MKTPELAPWLQRYFTEYLSAQRNVSHATIMAYRDTFRLLLKHLRKTHRRCDHYAFIGGPYVGHDPSFFE